MNIVLTGFMASGKTTVGKILAERLGMNFIDTDEMIVAKYGDISEFFKNFGEERFRKIETEAVKAAAASDNAVIATGGGAVLKTENTEILKKNGIIVNLSPERSVIEARLANGDETRPLSNGGIEALTEKFENRRKYYDMCDIKVAVTLEKDAQAVADEIENRIKSERNVHHGSKIRPCGQQ